MTHKLEPQKNDIAIVTAYLNNKPLFIYKIAEDFTDLIDCNSLAEADFICLEPVSDIASLTKKTFTTGEMFAHCTQNLTVSQLNIDPLHMEVSH